MERNDFIYEAAKINRHSTITLCCGNESPKEFRFDPDPESDDYELHEVNGKSKYGLSCKNVTEVIGVLICDFAYEMITSIKVD